MEPRQIMMLTILVLVGLVGSCVLVYVLNNLDKKEEDQNDHGH